MVLNRKPKKELKNADISAAGLPGAEEVVEDRLRYAGIDPDRLSIRHLGVSTRFFLNAPAWLIRMLAGFALWTLLGYAGRQDIPIPGLVNMFLALGCGVVILQGACQSLLISATSMAARLRWNHYTAGTLSEILATLPELVMIGFVVTVSPHAAFLIAVITIYNNSLVFSIYSYFLPKDKLGKFVMPEPITQAGTQILIAGAAVGLVVGIVMMVFSASEHPKNSFNSGDLLFISVLLLAIFGVYLYKLIHNYTEEEQAVYETLELDERQQLLRKTLVYRHIQKTSLLWISATLLFGIAGAFAGGHIVSLTAEIALADLGFNTMLTALMLAGFAGMSEYVMIWTAHRKREYGIALANAFGGITQVVFLILPFTLLSIVVHQVWFAGAAGNWLVFSVPNILLLVFLYPTLYTLSALLENDHTFDILDTTIMTMIVTLLLFLLVFYSNG